MSCTRTVWLIDTENVQKKWLNVVHFKTKKDKLIIFIGPEATYMSLKELQVFLAKYPVNQVEFCVSNAGKNSMDFHVVAKLGSLCTTGKKSNYIIVSADKGYDGLIVGELTDGTRLYIYNEKRGGYYVNYAASRYAVPITNNDLKKYPEELRPQLTGNLAKVDISEPSYKILLQNYAEYKDARDDRMKKFYYNQFRQGLDILDLDDFTYQMLEMNPNTMGFWLPTLAKALYGNKFFKIPDTKILRVPLPMLQLTRLGFETLNPVTKEIVNRYCKRIFKLDEHKDYFIKTGTYSSKYEFRNAHIYNPKEINEMGEYFLFLNHLTCSMASPLNNTCFYGANTTNEWVLREYIKDKENNPTIYNGLPLHTEYRVFVDFDADEVLGISPYWRADVMKGKFKNASTPQERHDYVIYQMHEDILQSRYDDSARMILDEIKKILPAVELVGQWSIDVMRNGDDYYIIDMALAENSALNDCVPRNKLRAYPQQWLPEHA